MFVNKKYPFYELAYKTEKYFYRSAKHKKFYSYFELEDIIKERKNNLYDLYVSKWAINEKGERISGIYFDIDGEDLQKVYDVSLKIYHYLIEMFKLKNGISFVFSGAKGFHIETSDVLIGMSEILDDDKKDFVKWFAKKVERDLGISGYIDYRVYEIKRIWRMEKTINSKSNLFCHRLPNRLIGADLDEILNWCEYLHDYPLYQENERLNFYAGKVIRNLYKEYVDWKNTKKKQIAEGNQLTLEDEIAPCIVDVFEKKVPEGFRNTTLYVISRVLNKVYSLQPEDIYDFVVDWCFRNEMNDSEIFPTILSACKSENGFTCLNSSYIAYLLNEGVMKCPYINDDLTKERIMKLSLCPIYRKNKLYSKINKYSENLNKLYNSLSNFLKQKKWNQARETMSIINKLHEEIIGGFSCDKCKQGN